MNNGTMKKLYTFARSLIVSYTKDFEGKSDQKKNEFKLDNLSAAHYNDLYRDAHFTVIKKIERLRTDQRSKYECNGDFEAVLQLGKEDEPYSFEIYLDLDNDVIPTELLGLAEKIIGNVTQMDDAARAIPGYQDENEELWHITISPSKALFRYVSNAVNTEWDVVFQLSGKGDWTCLGIPVPGKPRGFHI